MCRSLNFLNMISLNAPCYRDTKYKGHVTVTMSYIEEDLSYGDYNMNNIDNKVGSPCLHIFLQMIA